MKVNFFATLRDIAGGKVVEIPISHGSTAKEVLDAIISKFPAMEKELLSEDGRLYGHVHFFVNGRDVQFLEDDFETKIMPEDEITIFPAVGGLPRPSGGRESDASANHAGGEGSAQPGGAQLRLGRAAQRIRRMNGSD